MRRVTAKAVITTVDHADIRGLDTTLLLSVGCLPRSRHEGCRSLITPTRVASSPGLRLLQTSV